MTVKDLIIFLTGVSIGATAGWYLTKKKIEKKAFEHAEKEIEEMKEYYGISDRYERVKEALPEEEDDSTPQIDKSSVSSARTALKDRVPYHKYYDVDQTKLRESIFTEHPLDQGEEGEEAPPEPEDVATEQHKADFDKPPERVTEEDLGSIPEWYDTKTIYYYMYDEVFADEDENEIHDPILLFGDDFYNSHYMENDEMMAYIRNYQHDTLYEIQKVWASYDETR